MKKKWIVFWLVVAAAILTLLTAVAVAWVGAARNGMIAVRSVAMVPGAMEQDAAEQRQRNGVAPGEMLNATIDFAVPWGQSLEKVEFQPGTGIVGVGAPDYGLERIAWRANVMRVTVPLRAYRTGKLAAGTVTATFERPMIADGARRVVKEVKLPELTVMSRAVPEDTKLPLAGALAPPADQRWRWAIGIAGALAVLLVLALIWRARRRKRALKLLPQTPWEVAAAELAGLRRQSERGERPASWCVARLTDVVRNYLSARFRLPARQQTTGEFLRSLKRPDSPLTVEQGHNLADFMTAADLVKFAGQTPEAGYLENAIVKAEILVDQTRPHEEVDGENPVVPEGQVKP